MKDVPHIADQEFPMRSGTIGFDVIDISTLYGRTGRFTYDPSFTSTASCESRITYIAVGLLSRQHRHCRPTSAHGRVDADDRQDADHRGDGL